MRFFPLLPTHTYPFPIHTIAARSERISRYSCPSDNADATAVDPEVLQRLEAKLPKDAAGKAITSIAEYLKPSKETLDDFMNSQYGPDTHETGEFQLTVTARRHHEAENNEKGYSRQDTDAQLTLRGVDWGYLGSAFSAHRVTKKLDLVPNLCITSPLNRTVLTSTLAEEALRAAGHEPGPRLVLSQAIEQTGAFGSSVEDKEFNSTWISGQAPTGPETGSMGILTYNRTKHASWTEPLEERAKDLAETIVYLGRGIHRRTGLENIHVSVDSHANLLASLTEALTDTKTKFFNGEVWKATFDVSANEMGTSALLPQGKTFRRGSEKDVEDSLAEVDLTKELWEELVEKHLAALTAGTIPPRSKTCSSLVDFTPSDSKGEAL